MPMRPASDWSIMRICKRIDCAPSRSISVDRTAIEPLDQVGLQTAIKPLLSRCTTGEFNSPPNYSRNVLMTRTRTDRSTHDPLMSRVAAFDRFCRVTREALLAAAVEWGPW
eukprot:6770916-Pyramimonas_sp.AAC.1